MSTTTKAVCSGATFSASVVSMLTLDRSLHQDSRPSGDQDYSERPTIASTRSRREWVGLGFEAAEGAWPLPLIGHRPKASPGMPEAGSAAGYARDLDLRAVGGIQNDGLDVHELAKAEFAQLAAVAAALHAAERQPRVGRHQAVDEHHARLDPAHQLGRPLEIARPQAGAQPVLGGIG